MMRDQESLWNISEAYEEEMEHRMRLFCTEEEIEELTDPDGQFHWWEVDHDQ